MRPLEANEFAAWPVILRGAALRFWTSRLLDFYKPATGEMTYAKDPAQYERVITHHAQRQDFWLVPAPV